MFNLRSETQNLRPRVPVYLPLAEAAQKYGLPETVLTQQIQAGKIEAVQLPTGELLVAAKSNGHELRTKKEIIAEKFAHLLRQQITIAEATRKYEIPRTTLLGWIELGYIEVVEKRHPKGINEADVAYCSRIYHEREGKRGSRLFDENGNPYRLKRPDIAEYRRRKQIKT